MVCKNGHRVKKWVNGIIFQNKTACPRCNEKSWEQRCLYDEIAKMVPGLEIKYDHRKLLGNLELDIYIPEKKLAVEYCGFRYHTEETKPKNYHQIKYAKCAAAGVGLITVFTHEWKKKRHVLSLIRERLGVTAVKISADACRLREVPPSSASLFFKANSLEDFSANPRHRFFGAYYENEIVACLQMTGKYKSSASLVRFCTALDCRVENALANIFNFAVAALGVTMATALIDLR